MMKSATSPVSPSALTPSTPQTFSPMPSVEPRSGEVGLVSLEKRTQAGNSSLAKTPTRSASGRLGSITRRPWAAPCSLRNTARSAGFWPSAMRFIWPMAMNISSSRWVALVAQSKQGGLLLGSLAVIRSVSCIVRRRCRGGVGMSGAVGCVCSLIFPRRDSCLREHFKGFHRK